MMVPKALVIFSPFLLQEEYYVTHQCFLSTRSLYLAVWDVTNGESGIEELGPWLHNIQVGFYSILQIWKVSHFIFSLVSIIRCWLRLRI